MADVDMVTTAEVTAALEISGTGRNTLIAALITQASHALNAKYQRELTPQTTSTARRFTVRRVGPVELAPYELRAVTSVSLHPQTASPVTLTDGTDYTLGPIDARTSTYLQIILARSLGISGTFLSEFGYTQIAVTATWGAWATANVRADVKRACIVTVGAWMDRAVSEYGDVALEDGRALLPAGIGSWAIPQAAHSLMMASGLPRIGGIY